MRCARAPLSCLLLLSISCSDARQLISLSRDFNREYPDTRVGVSLTDRIILTVTLGDSPLVLAPCERQAGLAVRVAGFLRDHYEGLDSLSTVSIAFTTRKPEGIPPKQVRLPFRFAPAAIRAGLTAADSARAVAACRAWEELQ